MEHSHPPPEGGGANRTSSISRYVFLGFLAIAAYFLISEHRAHVIGWLPFLLLAACPLLHLFHHGGHGGGHADGEQSPSPGESLEPARKSERPGRPP